jgi:hypothetical protein
VTDYEDDERSGIWAALAMVLVIVALVFSVLALVRIFS